MKLDQYILRPRVRSTFEIMDLGTLLFQRDGLMVIRSGLILWLPVGALAAATLVFGNLLFAILLLSLVRPLLGRVGLYVYSRRVFSEPLTPSQVVLAIPRFVFKGLFGLLISRRLFASARTFTDPIVVLEELGKVDGKGYRERTQDLLSNGTRGALWRLGRGMALIEVCLILAVIALIGAFVPDPLPDLTTLVELGEIPMKLKATLLFSQWITLLLTEPLWTAAGFAMYLCRRSELEGWDVELAFRSLAQRLGGSQSMVAHGAWVGCLWLALGSGTASLVQTPQAADQRGLASPVERVYARPELSTTVERWDLVDPKRSEGTEFVDLSAVFDVLVWLLVGALTVFLLFQLFRWMLGRNPGVVVKRPKPAKPLEVLLGLDLRSDRLPSDVHGTAWDLWAAGDAKGALSLLYRGSLVLLRDRERMLLEAGDTEARCVRKVQELGNAARAEYFQRLTDCWQALAYGECEAEEAEFEGLSKGYQEHFGGVF